MLKTGVINLVLRGLTVGSKFVLLMFLARYLAPEDLGVYGLILVTISISLYLLGVDFYTYNTREILAGEIADCPSKLRDQLVFHGLAYAVVLPALLVVFATGTIEWAWIGWFYLLLVMEHLSQEFYRVLVTLSRSTTANVVLFLRSGVWVYAVVVIGLVSPDVVSLQSVIGAWSIGVGLSLVIGLAATRHLDWSAIRSAPIDWPWIRNGARVAGRFFVATLALLGAQYADRYFLQYFYGESAVGVYTLFWQIANGIQVFVYTGIIMVQFPPVLEALQKGQPDLYRTRMRRMVGISTVSIVAVAVLLLVAIRPLLNFTGKATYADNIQVFWILLAASVLFASAYLPHYSLYAKRRDSAIVGTTITAVVFGLAANAILVPTYGLVGAATANCTAMLVLFGGKSLLAWRYRITVTTAGTRISMKKPAETISRRKDELADQLIEEKS